MSTILVVDDDQMFRAVLRQRLEQASHAVVEAADGREALNWLRQRSFDLVIVDIFMPHADGIETVREIRKEGYRLPIVVMSGGSGDNAADFLVMAEKLGANAILRKPFRYRDLLALVARLAERPISPREAKGTC